MLRAGGGLLRRRAPGKEGNRQESIHLTTPAYGWVAVSIREANDG
jgi:hypothetical protein